MDIIEQAIQHVKGTDEQKAQVKEMLMRHVDNIVDNNLSYGLSYIDSDNLGVTSGAFGQEDVPVIGMSMLSGMSRVMAATTGHTTPFEDGNMILVALMLIRNIHRLSADPAEVERVFGLIAPMVFDDQKVPEHGSMH